MGCDYTFNLYGRLSLDFNPRIPYGMRLPVLSKALDEYWISIHASRMGCDQGRDRQGQRRVISIHASRMGCDIASQIVRRANSQFQSTHPVWDATRSPRKHDRRSNYFNPRIPYGMRRALVSTLSAAAKFQSTHPVWDATGLEGIDVCFIDISIHASRMGCDDTSISAFTNFALFQSTHPVWDATRCCRRRGPRCRRFQSTHPVWDATGSWLRPAVRRLVFQSTHPVWDATHRPVGQRQRRYGISIHASRMGCDFMSRTVFNAAC